MNRLKIALIFNFNPGWTGGIIYLVNIARILKFLNPDDQPQLLVFYPKHLKKFVDEIDYGYMEKIEWNFPKVHLGFVMSLLKRKNMFISELITEFQPDVIFPMQNYPVKSKKYPAELCWYADLQHKYYPEFFSKIKRFERDLRIRFILKNAKHILVSSHDVKNDFYKFFEVPNTINFHVYHFVSIIEGLSTIPLSELLNKYKLPSNYFMVCNQFHKHKNHKVIFEAIAMLKARGVSVHVAISGNFPSEPNSTYLNELHELIENHNLNENITLLGLIPRGDQLLIMKNARAILQPSLFEGWSTVIEDAKSLHVPVIASDLKVNKEQLEDKGYFFPSHNASKLASLMESTVIQNNGEEIYGSYHARMHSAAYELLDIIKKSMN